MPRQKAPRVKLMGVDLSASEADLRGAVCALVNKDLAENDFKKIGMSKRKDSATWIFITTPEVLSVMVKAGKINIGWTKVTIQEAFNIRRCMRCCSYGHMTRECQEKVTCFKCAEHHMSYTCTIPPYLHACRACQHFNRDVKDPKRRVDSSHRFDSEQCPTYLREVDKARGRTQGS